MLFSYQVDSIKHIHTDIVMKIHKNEYYLVPGYKCLSLERDTDMHNTLESEAKLYKHLKIANQVSGDTIS